MTANGDKDKTNSKKWIKKTRRDSFVWARVTPEERKLIEKLSNAMGLSVAEFVRYVIVQELDRRSLLTSKIQRLKEEFGEANAGGKEKNE
jgi:uncharacterized protein (DUF1778 family)